MAWPRVYSFGVMPEHALAQLPLERIARAHSPQPLVNAVIGALFARRGDQVILRTIPAVRATN